MPLNEYENSTPDSLNREDSIKMIRMWEEVRSPKKEKAYNIHDFVLESWNITSIHTSLKTLHC